jgi:alkanesulfonate monooxygenase SsuD/methylene tetrahydromethanopterin reductase-like flavin-dependent oxidoreductase (luciferase family)
VSSEAHAFEAIVADLDGPAYVVTTAAGAERDGCLVGFALQCSIKPPRFAVWLSKENRTYRIAQSAATLVVHLLRQGDQDLAHLFGGETGDEVDKFEDVEWHPGPNGSPVLARCDWFAGTITDRIDTGDHVAFDAPWTQVREAASAAADAGFAGIWTPDHLDGRVFGATHVLECWTTLTAIAVSMPDVMVGPLVLNVANRDPALLATMAATLQDISGGRVLLGLGAGGGAGVPFRQEQTAIGRTVPADPLRRAQVEACVEEMRRLWITSGFLRPDPPPPIVIAVFGPKMAEIAGRIGDGINAPAEHPRLRDLVGIARDACAGADRDATGFLVTVYAAFDERWFDAESPARAELAALAVDRLILFLGPPFDIARRG